MEKNLIEPNNILIVALSGIGNFLMQSPVFKELKKQYPNAHITVWLAPRGTRVLAERNPDIDDIIESPIKLGIPQHLQLVYRLAKRKFDTGIMLSPGQLWKGAAYLFLAGIPHRLGNTYPFRGNPHSAFLLTHAIPEDKNLHDIEQNLRLLEPLGITTYRRLRRDPANGGGSLPAIAASGGTPPTAVAPYQLDIPHAFQDQAQTLLQRHKVADQQPLIGFHMGSAPNFLWKRWPIENFIEVGQSLIEKHHAHILIFGGPDENNLKQVLKKALGSHATVIEEDLLTTAAVMQRCQLFLSNDSGLMHLAAAVEVTTFGLFGPTDEKHTGPRGTNSFVIRAPGTTPVYATETNFALGDESHPAMRAVTAKMVIETIVPVIT